MGEIVSLFVFAGADINQLDSSGRSPLFWDISSGVVSLVKQLLLNGAKPDGVDMSQVGNSTRLDDKQQELVKKYILVVINANDQDRNKLNTVRLSSSTLLSNGSFKMNIKARRVSCVVPASSPIRAKHRKTVSFDIRHEMREENWTKVKLPIHDC